MATPMGASSGSGSEKALDLRAIYVDDEPINLRVVHDMLEVFGISVVCAGDGRTALEILDRDTFHVILMDIHMPHMSGLTCLQAIRSGTGLNKSAPVLALTADVTHDEAEYRAMGFNGLISKPVMMRPLLASILAVLEATGGRRALLNKN